MNKMTELKDQSNEILENMMYDLQGEIFQMRNELAGAHKIEKPHLIREKKRIRARILTILTQRKTANG